MGAHARVCTQSNHFYVQCHISCTFKVTLLMPKRCWYYLLYINVSPISHWVLTLAPMDHQKPINKRVSKYCLNTPITIWKFCGIEHVCEGCYGNNTRVICCPPQGRPESPARITSRQTTNEEEFAATPSQPCSLPIITWFSLHHLVHHLICIKHIYDKIRSNPPKY